MDTQKVLFRKIRHARYVGTLAKELTNAKATLTTVCMSLWQHSSDFALWSRMGERESDALLAAKAHDALLPRHATALSEVAASSHLLSKECAHYADRWGSTMEIADVLLTPEINHHCNNANHLGQIWRIPHCVLCQAKVTSDGSKDSAPSLGC